MKVTIIHSWYKRINQVQNIGLQKGSNLVEVLNGPTNWRNASFVRLHPSIKKIIIIQV